MLLLLIVSTSALLSHGEISLFAAEFLKISLFVGAIVGCGFGFGKILSSILESYGLTGIDR